MGETDGNFEPRKYIVPAYRQLINWQTPQGEIT